VQVCFTLAGYRGKIKVKKVLREFGLRTGSRFLGLRLAFAFHFSALLRTGEPVCARNLPRKPRNPAPFAPVREPSPAVRATVAGLLSLTFR